MNSGMKRMNILVFALTVLLLFQTSCKEDNKKVISTAPVEFIKEGELTIYKADTDSVITELNIEIADSDYETQTGLMYRDAMEADQGMLFVFTEEALHSFYMKNTKFPLDIIFIDKDLRIASIKEDALPLDESAIPSEVPVQYVLEVNAGQTAKWQVATGDRISYRKN
jgi:uncharacterized membrane protein (UPF0127 family)